MYIELEVRRPGLQEWHTQAIDDLLIDIVRPWKFYEAPASLIYDGGDVLLWECTMPYRRLLDKLNGLEDEKQTIGDMYRKEFSQTGNATGWFLSSSGKSNAKSAFAIEARFVGGCIDAESVRVVK